MKKLTKFPDNLKIIEAKILSNLTINDIKKANIYSSITKDEQYIDDQYHKILDSIYYEVSEEEKKFINKLNLEDLILDFSYYSQKIEGGTLTYEEARTITEGIDLELNDEKKIKSKNIFLGIRNALSYCIQQKEWGLDFTSSYEKFVSHIKYINSILDVGNIFDNRASGGMFKFEYINQTPTVTTNGKDTIYIYSDENKSRKDFEYELHNIYKLIKDEKYSNKFAKNLLVHSLLQELQIFNDGNSRTARIVTFALEIMDCNRIPIIFNDRDDFFYSTLLETFENDNYSILCDNILIDHELRVEEILKNRVTLINDIRKDR